MNDRPGLFQSLRQEMRLQPRLLQSIQVLQLPAQDLERWLRDAAEENVALRLEEPRRGEYEDGGRAGGARQGTREDAERHDAMLRNLPDRARSLHQRIEEQLGLLDADPRQVAWVRFLIGCLDEGGYLSAPDELLLEMARAAGLEGGEVELRSAVGLLRTLEPRGIGARDAVESLLMQIDADDPEYGLMRRLLEDFLEELARNKLPHVARSMGLDLDRLAELLDRLGSLQPRPAAELDGPASPVLRPDVVVLPAEGGHEIGLERSGLPSVTIDPEVAALARDREQDREVRGYLRVKVDRARQVVEAVEQRQHTLGRIAAAVFRHQRSFLERGPGHLSPLRMSDLAEELGVHVSTVSRGVSGKYAQTPWGIFPLRHFFQAGVGAEGARGPGSPPAGAAREDAREAARGLLAAEDPAAPLSDDEVAAALAARGLRLARRTVAKYREELGIPSSYRRRVYRPRDEPRD